MLGTQVRATLLAVCAIGALADPAPNLRGFREANSSVSRRLLAPLGSNPQPNFRLVIENNCADEILIRNAGSLERPQTAWGDSCIGTNCVPLKPGEKKEYRMPQYGGTFIVVLGWGDYRGACLDGTFCQQFEFQPEWNSNVVNQKAFSMPVGVAYFHKGELVKGCPEAGFAECMRTGKCRSNAGKWDICAFDAEGQCPQHGAYLVKTDPRSKHFYCISPDKNRAVISHLMENPTEAECAKKPPFYWHCGGVRKWGGCQNVCTHRSDLTALANQLEIITGKGFFDVHGRRIPPEFFSRPPFSPGAKHYQTAVNRMCSNQPPTQKIYKWHGWTQFSHQKWRVSDEPSDRLFDSARPEQYLDHAITYEGDDTNYWRWWGKTVYMAGNVGIGCHTGEPFDAYHIKACPA